MRPLPSPISFSRLAMGCAALAICYYLGARAGLMLAIEKTNASPLWPPAGIAVAGLLLIGWRAWPGVWIGALAANLLVFHENQAGPAPMLWCVSAGIATGNTLGAIVGWKLCRRWIGYREDGMLRLDRDHLFERMGVFQFTAAALSAGLASALIGPATVCVSEIAPWKLYPLMALTWWCGDATGVLYVAPFVLCVLPSGWLPAPRGPEAEGHAPARREHRAAFWSEAALAFLSLAFACFLVMTYAESTESPGLQVLALKFVIIAPLTWIAVRVGTRGTAVALPVLAGFVVWHARELSGHLDSRDEITTVLIWLGFLWIVGMTSLTLSSIVTSNKRAIASLRDAKAALEATMDAIPALVCFADDRDCHHIRGNAVAHELLRIPLGDNLSKSPRDGAEPAPYEARIDGVLCAPEDLTMQRAASTGKAVTGQEMELTFPDGETRIIYGNAVPLLDERGVSHGCVAAFVDVTQPRLMEKALRESKKQLADELDAMTRMQQANVRLAQMDDLESMMGEILDAAIEISHADMGNVQLLEDGVLRIVVQRGFDAPFLEFFDAVHSGEAACGTAMWHGARLIVDDVARSPVFANTPALKVMLAAKARAVQSTPLVSHSGNVLGMFSTHYRTPQRPRERALQFLDILARQAADMIERKRTERALRESEQRFRAMADSAPVMIWMSDVDTQRLYFNKQWLEFTGRPHEQESGEGWAEGVHPDDLARFQEVQATSFKARLEFHVEYRLRRHDGEYRWILDHGVPRFGAEGSFAGYIGSCLDVTESRRAESDTALLLGLAEQRRTASAPEEVVAGAVNALGPHLSAGRCFFATVDADGENFTVKHEQAAHGLPLVGEYSMSTFGPDVVAALRAGSFVTISNVNQDRRTVGRTESFRRLGARACAIAPLVRDGRTTAMLVITTPGTHTWEPREISLLITVAERMWLAMERLRLGVELSASEARFRTMAEWVPVFIFTTGADGSVDYVNERFSDFTGMSQQAASGDGWMRAIHPEDQEAAVARWRAAIQSGQPFSHELRLHSVDGNYRWFRSNAHPVYAGRGSIVKWFGSCADIDDLMDTQAKLKSLNETLEEHVQDRTQKLQTANEKLASEFEERQRLEREMLDISERERRVLGSDLHDGVCQYLTGLAFMTSTQSQMLRDKKMVEEGAKLEEIAAHIRTAATQTRNVAKGLHPVDVDANGLVAALKELASRHSPGDSKRCRLRCPRPVPIQDNNVALHLYRITQEAVVNAIKHAKAGKIVIELNATDTQVILSVTDNGAGLPEGAQQASGMGLHLMRYRASVIGGELKIQRPKGGGTVVTCYLPLAAKEKSAAPDEEVEEIMV